MPPRGRGPAVEKAKDFKGTVRRVIGYTGRYKAGVAAVMLCAAASAVFHIVSPKILGKATTSLSEGLMKKITGTGGIDFSYIGKILLIVLALYAASFLFSLIQGLTMSSITQRLCYKLRKDITEKMDRMPLKYFESKTYGEVLSRITNDVDTFGNGFNQSVTQLITSVTTMIGVVIMMLTISPLMTLITLLILPVSLVFIGAVMKKSQKYFKQQQEYLGHINGQVEENYSGHLVVKAFGKENDVIDRFSSTNNVLYESAWKSQFLSGLMMPVMQFVGNLGYVGVAISGAFLAVRGTIEIGDILAFITYVRNFTQPMQQIAQVTNMMQSMAAAAERVFEFLDEEEEDQTTENAVSVGNISGVVDFTHVSFGYDPEKIIIKDFNAHVDKGKQIAIVGPTGAGKTTMVKLLMK